MNGDTWIPAETMFEKALRVIKEARTTNWLWFKHPNIHVKYINIRVDMRTGDCVVTDNQGKLFDINTLKEQSPTGVRLHDES